MKDFIGTVKMTKGANSVNMTFYNEDVKELYDVNGYKDINEDIRRLTYDCENYYFELKQKIRHIIADGWFLGSAFLMHNERIDLAIILQDDDFFGIY
jgi:hypothetical protein